MKYEDFYDNFSGFYDSMTGFENRFKREKPFFIEMLKKFRLSKTLDIGCGTGFHSFLLADLGMEVTGIDPSKGMIDIATSRLKDNKNIKFINTDLPGLRENSVAKYDAAFCLGNTLPHITDRNEAIDFFKQVKSVLSDGGVFILQIVNYNKVLKKKERILNIKENGGRIYVRFYDFLPQNIIFNILTIIKSGDAFENKLISTELYPYTMEELEEIVKLSGFNISDKLGNIQFKEYNPEISENIILILT
jgi:glycine/sarcosine N-methyltransferase